MASVTKSAEFGAAGGIAIFLLLWWISRKSGGGTEDESNGGSSDNGSGTAERKYSYNDVPSRLLDLWSTFDQVADYLGWSDASGKRTMIIAIAWKESAINPNTPDGAAGEIGIMQIKPSTAADYGYSSSQLRVLINNIMAGGLYFDTCLAAMGSALDAFRAYNAGVNGATSDHSLSAAYATDVLQRYYAVYDWENIYINGEAA